MLEAEAFKEDTATLPLGLGKSISGDPVVADLARMPHLLVAGTTGSGKSVGINAMVLSLLYRHTPDECRILMIDPKMLELSVYNGIPHLLTPVITDPHKAVAALNWVVREMEERYKRMAALSVRNIDVFNNRIRNAKKRGEILSRTVQTGFDTSGQARFETQKMDLELLPHIVVIVDEFADLMIVAGKEVEAAVQRLAQMARAAGIHLIMATQRPSVDIITGTIKANFPTRIASRWRRRSTAAPSSTSRAPSSCWARATCCSRPGRPTCACTGRSSPTRRWKRSPTYLRDRGATLHRRHHRRAGSERDGRKRRPVSRSEDDLYERAVASCCATEGLDQLPAAAALDRLQSRRRSDGAHGARGHRRARPTGRHAAKFSSRSRARRRTAAGV